MCDGNGWIAYACCCTPQQQANKQVLAFLSLTVENPPGMYPCYFKNINITDDSLKLSIILVF